MMTTEKTDIYQTFYGLTAPVKTLVNTPSAYTGPTYRPGDGSYYMAIDALEFHFHGDEDDAPCCTFTAPCDDAAFRLLATGKAGTTSGTMTRDDDRSTGLDERNLPRGNGNSGKGKPARPVMTDGQAKFFESLCAEITELATAEGSQSRLDFVADCRAEMEMTGEYAGKRPSFDQVSKTLDLLKSLRDSLRKRARTEESEALQAKLVEGLYLKDDTIYRVKKSQESGRLYGQRLVIPDGLAEGTVEERLEMLAAGAFKGRGRESLKFEYQGVEPLKFLTPDDLISEEKAREFGRRFGFCCCCARILSKKRSIEAGVGPVCADKYGYDY